MRPDTEDLHVVSKAMLIEIPSDRPDLGSAICPPTRIVTR